MRNVFILILVLMMSQITHAQWDDQTPPNEVPVYLPDDYDPKVPSPLVIFLHGWAPISPVWYDILVQIPGDLACSNS